MLMHADDILGSDELRAWRDDPANKNVSVPGDDRSPSWTWQTYLYRDNENGVVTIPSENLMVCLRSAGTQLTLKGQKTYKEVTQSGIVPESEFFRFESRGKQIELAAIDAMRDATFSKQCEAAKALGFVLFAKRAKIGKAKHVRVRARFDSWSLSGALATRDAALTQAVLDKLFELAGRIGLCDWRPGCGKPGIYGMFNGEIWPAK